MANIKLVIAYDGSAYFGWQKTRMGPSIQQFLEDALATVLRVPVRLQAASRTDAGVHAKGQVVQFSVDQKPDLIRLVRSLNGILPRDIVVQDAAIAPDDFHPTLNAAGKIYHYNVCFGKVQLPHHRHYSWHFPQALDIELMRQSSKELIGKHDFSAFTNVKKNEPYADHIRHLKRIEIEQCEPERLRFIIEGDHFLYKMVRNIVGTLCYKGCGKLKDAAIKDLLLLQDRRLMGITAPAHGLLLHEIHYDSSFPDRQ